MPFEEKRKLLQLEALYDVGRALNTLRPEGELLEDLMHRAVATLDASVGFVFSLDDDFRPQHAFVIGVEDEALAERVIEEPPVKQIIASREPVNTTVPQFLRQRGGAFIGCPMVASDRLIGVLGVFGK